MQLWETKGEIILETKIVFDSFFKMWMVKIKAQFQNNKINTSVLLNSKPEAEVFLKNYLEAFKPSRKKKVAT